MPLGTQFQTIVYYEDTGDIHAVLLNQYIKSRKSLNALVGLAETTGMKFFYVPGYYPLRKEDWTVEIGDKHKSPRLKSRTGEDGAMVLLKKEAEYILENYKETLFVFEGGMGDYIDQADVIIACRKNYPNKKIKISIEGSRSEALNLLKGFKDAATIYGGDPSNFHLPTIEFAAISRGRGSYEPEGKIGIYSCIAGLNKTAKRAKVEIPEDDIKNARAIIEEAIGRKYKTLIALHTTSGNSNTKGIPPEDLPDVLSSLIDNKELYFLHFGDRSEKASSHEKIISLHGKLNWKQTFAVMSLCAGCVCIDSAVLHIAQHLMIPTVSFWGPTDYKNILGKETGVEQVTTTLDCKGCNLYQCREANCMENFDKKEINRKLKKLSRG